MQFYILYHTIHNLMLHELSTQIFDLLRYYINTSFLIFSMSSINVDSPMSS